MTTLKFPNKSLFIAVLIANGLTCNITDPIDSILPPLPEDAALYISVDDVNYIGLRIINANSIEMIDSLNTEPGVPWTIEFSPDFSTLYSCWGRGADYSIYSCDVQPLRIQNKVQFQYAKSSLIKSLDEKYLVAYGYKGIDIFDRISLSLINQDTSIFDNYSGIRISHLQNKIYSVWGESQQLIGFSIFDLDSLKIIDTLKLFDNISYPGLADVDFVISPDDRYLFFSAWNWRGLGGFGSFFVIDLIQKKIMNEFRVGAFSQLVISPDGQSVYISDPGGYLYMFQSSRKVWRYDIKTNSMNVLLIAPGSTDRIAVAEDNRTIFISSWQFIIDGKHTDIIKVDANSGRIVGTYSVPLDSTGAIAHIVRNIKIGKYPKTLANKTIRR